MKGHLSGWENFFQVVELFLKKDFPVHITCMYHFCVHEIWNFVPKSSAKFKLFDMNVYS